jgi:radical SAM superfamily enzyme YgiQ (UPF0313 family)
MALKIYLADLTHVGVRVATEAFPLNIGLNASYAIKSFGKDVDISLFKYPDDLLQALKETPPDVLGCSNYSWNSNLSYYFAQLGKTLNPNMVTLWGGTNYPFDAENQEGFLRKRPLLDIHIFYEGELALSNIIRKLLSASTPNKIFNSPIDGCQFISPEDGSFVSGAELSRIKILDSIPSPYTTGLLDKFFDGKLTPLLETARGCPFLCNFCNAGDSYFNNVNKFSDDYVLEELHYVAKKISKIGVGHLTLADNNFGMIPRDTATTEVIHDLQQKYGWPKGVTIWTGKNSKRRVIEATRLLGKTLSISMSAQSMDESVLENVKRDNIRLEDFQAIAEELDAQGRPQHAEIILPLPGETFKSHIDGLNALLDTRVHSILSHTLQMLHGTPYKDDEDYVKRLGYQTKFRIVPLDFTILDDDYIFDTEEVGIATKDMSFEEYIEARKYLLVSDLCHSSHIFKPLQRYLSQSGIKNSEWIQKNYDGLKTSPDSLKEVFESFKEETVGELWDSEEDLVRYYSNPENYRKLISGERGGNVLFKHRAWMLSQLTEPFVSIVFKNTKDLLFGRMNPSQHSRLEAELSALKSMIMGSVSHTFSPEVLGEMLTMEIKYDVIGWRQALNNRPLSDFLVSRPLLFKFYLSDEDKLILQDVFSRYGTDMIAFAKIIQRYHGTPLRQLDYAEASDDAYTTSSLENNPASIANPSDE